LDRRVRRPGHLAGALPDGLPAPQRRRDPHPDAGGARGQGLPGADRRGPEPVVGPGAPGGGRQVPLLPGREPLGAAAGQHQDLVRDDLGVPRPPRARQGMAPPGTAVTREEHDRPGGRTETMGTTGGGAAEGVEERRALAELAAGVAREAGELAADGQEGIGVLATKSTPTDVVTAMDRSSEELIRKRLLSARPGDAVLGEEGGEEAGAGGAGRVRWIVDPIDGTVNYLYGREEWAVSIAAEVEGRVVAGAVAVPRRGQVYTAVLGGGSFLDGRPLQAPEAPSLDFALIATGFGYDPRRRAWQAEVLRTVLPRVRDIRR